MDNIFNTDSGLRPPSPLTFSSAPGQGLFGDSLGYEDLRFPNQDFINMPVSPGQSAPAQPPPPNMMMMAPNEPSMQLFNPSEQRYFSEFLDTLVVDQDFTFDPSAIPNLPNLSLFSQDALPAGFNLESSQNTNNPYMLPANTGSSSSSATQQLQQQLYPHQHSIGAATMQGAMDYDMSTGFQNNGQQESAYGSQAVPAKRTKTNKANGTSSDALTLDATHSRDAAAAAAASKQLSKLSLENPHHTNGHHHAGTLPSTSAAKSSSKAKKNKREEVDKYAQASGHRNHRGSSSSTSSRSRSHSQSQSRAQLKEEESGHEQHDSVSDDYASDAPALKGNNNNNTNNTNNNSTPKGTTHDGSSSSPTSAAATSATTKRKPYKELLTEEEKRANHIASEQKRRNTIRNGFKDMTDIIPDLKDVNSSKSTILFKAVDFIKYLERRNQILQEKAQLLETRLNMQKGQHPHPYQHPSPPQQHQQHQQHSQQHSQQQPLQSQKPYHLQHPQHSYPHQQQQQQYQNQQLAAYNGAGLDDKRLQDIPNIYPVGLTR